MKIIVMIPARMGSQRLKQKNLRLLNGIPLITHAIRKAKSIDLFDEVWVNSEHDKFGEIAREEGVFFHKRPAELADNQATSEDFVYEFLSKHECDYLFQVHSIAPLLTTGEIELFIKNMIEKKYDVQLSIVNEQIECAYQGKPINFTFKRKQNSQELKPIQRITWSITGWDRSNYIYAYENGKCATYFGKVGYFLISRNAGYIIKNYEDFLLVESLFSLLNN
jgi:CMP-N-acetylneuraminic acid synthetase